MKKSLLALAVLGAFAGVAQAQTSVTIYGSFDAGVRRVTNVNAAGNSNLTMGSTGQYNSNRIGFKGVEDLGGGMNAHFNLETGFNTGTGALNNTANRLFERAAFVGLGGAWGSLDLGRQYSVNFKTIGAYDPFNFKYVNITPLANQGGLIRLDNDIQYTGVFGPITARAEYALGEVAGSTSNGATQAVGLSYAGGPFSMGAAYTQRKNNVAAAPVISVLSNNFTTPASTPAAGTAFSGQDQKNWTVGGAFTTGPFRVALGYADSKQATPVTGDYRLKDMWVGGSYNLTPAAALTVGYYETKSSYAGAEGKRKLAIIGGTYALSKRTNFYADIDNAKFSGSAIGLYSPARQDRQTGVSVGVNHLF